MLTFGTVLFMHGYVGGTFLLKCGFFLILFVMYVWWRDIIREGTFEGQHTETVQTGLKMGMLLFIVSEKKTFPADLGPDLIVFLCILVATNPGAIQLTDMPSNFNSSAIVSVNLTKAAFEVAYEL